MTKRMLIRWIILVSLMSVLAYVFIQLGEWQLRRLEERRNTNAQVVAHSHSEAVPYEQIMDHEITDADQWQVVRVRGSYTGDTFHVRYRNQSGAGAEVLSVLRAEDGRLVLVDRGFVPKAQSKPDAAPPAPPEGEVEIVGYVKRDERGQSEAITPHSNNIRLINSAAISESLGTSLVNGYIAAISSAPADHPSLQPIALPALDEGPHLSYAWQWFSFTAIALVGVVVLIRADIRDYRRATRKSAKRQEAEQQKPRTGSETDQGT